MSMSRSGVVAFLAALGVLGGVTAANAAAGGLDQTFGSGGIVTTAYNGPFPAAAALQSDGRIVVIAGFDNDPAATDPVCTLSPNRHKVDALLATLNNSVGAGLVQPRSAPPADAALTKPDWLYRPNPA